jgi:septum formation protein
MHFILASASPRRRELLISAGFDFETCASHIEEVHRPGETPEEYVSRLATDKALAVARLAASGSLVLGADTEVVIDGLILGKPRDGDDATRMLRLLAGRVHVVITGVCLASAPDHIEASKAAVTNVTFRALDEREIHDYVQSGEPLDKAGAYGIQGLASKFVTRIEGSYFNVMGLPVHLVYEMLKPYLARDHQRAIKG